MTARALVLLARRWVGLAIVLGGLALMAGRWFDALSPADPRLRLACSATSSPRAPRRWVRCR